MKISEKQIMQLQLIARNYIEELNKKDPLCQMKARKISQIMDENYILSDDRFYGVNALYETREACIKDRIKDLEKLL